MLTDEKIIKIAADTKTGEPGLHGYILPISFAREIERAVLAKAMEKSQSDATGRSIQDYAIEHAEYMATSAEQLLNHLNECTNIDDCVIEPDENFSDYTSGLRLSIHDFRKRRDRAKAMPIPKQEPVGYVVIGQGISFYRTTKEEAEYQANALEWRDDKEPVIHPVYIQPQPAQAAAIPEDIPYVIKKGGVFYDIGSAGYVSRAITAELYTKQEAQKEESATHGECKAIPVTDLGYSADDLQGYIDRITRMHNAMLSASPKPE